MKRCSILLVLVFFVILSCSTTAFASFHDNSTVKAWKGAWARYVGAPPLEEYEWIEVSVIEVNGSVIDLSMRYDLRAAHRGLSDYYPNNARLFSINVTSGTSNHFFFFIPAHLSVGDRIPAPEECPELRIEGVEQKTYAGMERTVIYTTWSNRTIPHADFFGEDTFYWDKETGLLVEMVAKVGGEGVTCQMLTGTSLWSASLADWLAGNFLVVMIFVSEAVALAGLAIAMLKLRRGGLVRVTRPNEGRILAIVGIALLSAAVVNLTVFDQTISSLSFALAPMFLVIGVLAYTGGWVTFCRGRGVVDIGVLLMASALFFVGAVAAFSTYREIGAIVPYNESAGFYTTWRMHLGTYQILEMVFFYPYSWAVSIFATIALCLGIVGLLYKLLGRY
jgi:hypothetical protein